MNLLTSIKIGWPALRDGFDKLINAINLRTPRQGSGVTINESPSGFIISLADVPVLVAGGAGGSGLTADQIALLKALANDPGIQGTYAPTDPPTDHSHDTVNGPVQWIPYNDGKLTGWRLITYLSPIADPVTGYSVNTLYDVWSWTGKPFNPRVCTANTFGPPTS
jgi:hypothetical protein